MKVPWNSPGRHGDATWHRVVVYGFGASGRAATEFLRRRDVEVVVLDRRLREEIDFGPRSAAEWQQDDGIHWRLGEAAENGLAENSSADDLRTFDGVVVSPGVPPDRPLLRAARERGLPIIAEVELAAPFLEGTVIGITGSNGKSTTTALTGEILRQAGFSVEVCGNIGVPLCAVVDGPSELGAEKPRERHFVVELSSFQLEGVERFHPAAAALLNLSPDHLDRHRDMASYLAIKARIFAAQNENDVAVLNADDPWVAELSVASRRRFFSSRGAVADGCFVAGDDVLERGSEPDAERLFGVADMPLGPHNVENAMAAALLARTLGVSTDDLASAIRGFRGLPHRMELVAEHGGVRWYDDSKGTNLGATLRSLEGFADGQLHVILGGRNKGADLSPLREAVARKARRVYLIGETASELESLLRGAMPSADIVDAGTLATAVTEAVSSARAGEAVLLSPACASFDQFRNFVERGQVFQRLVLERMHTGPADESGGSLG